MTSDERQALIRKTEDEYKDAQKELRDLEKRYDKLTLQVRGLRNQIRVLQREENEAQTVAAFDAT